MNSFIYLDQYKLYSLSAQLFGGITKSLVEITRTEKKEGEEQRGPVGSGRVESDLLTNAELLQESKFLHDYNFTRFEKELKEREKVLCIDTSNVEKQFLELPTAQFVSVSGRSLITDVDMLTSFLSEFNKLGEAVTYVSNFEDMQKARLERMEELKSSQDRNRKKALKKQLDSITDIRKIAQKAGLNQDQKFLNHLASLLQYMLQDSLELSINLEISKSGALQFTAPLNREFLRESCTSLIRKFSRRTEDPLTIFGILTQGKVDGAKSTEAENEDDNNTQDITFRTALCQMVHAFADIEQSFIGRVQGEYVIDPIAVFKPL